MQGDVEDGDDRESYDVRGPRSVSATVLLVVVAVLVLVSVVSVTFAVVVATSHGASVPDRHARQWMESFSDPETDPSTFASTPPASATGTTVTVTTTANGPPPPTIPPPPQQQTAAATAARTNNHHRRDENENQLDQAVGTVSGSEVDIRRGDPVRRHGTSTVAFTVRMTRSLALDADGDIAPHRQRIPETGTLDGLSAADVVDCEIICVIAKGKRAPAAISTLPKTSNAPPRDSAAGWTAWYELFVDAGGVFIVTSSYPVDEGVYGQNQDCVIAFTTIGPP